MRLIRFLIGIALLCYLLLGALLMLLEKRMVYFPDEQDFTGCADFSDAEPTFYKGARFYYKEISQEKAVVFYHGNAGSACGRSVLKEPFEQAGYSYLFVEYPGFSNDTIAPSKKAILEEVHLVREFLSERGLTKVLTVGESLGSGPAAYHAQLGGVERVLLLTPYYELADMGGAFRSLYPLRLMMRENYTTGKWLKSATIPVSILYASSDENIPLASTRKLYDTLLSPEKQMIGIEGATHNTMYRHSETFELMRSFLVRQ